MHAANATEVPAALATTFLWVGQAFPRRHLREALLAFTAITRTEPATFRIIGPDRYPAPTIGALVSAINETTDRPTVFWDTYVADDELAAAYASADVIVYVSATEAFGFPPLEALTYGTPAVLADTPVNRELYGPHAFYVPLPVTEAGLAAAMRASMHDAARRDEIRAAAPSITEQYAWSRYSDRFLAAMRDLSAS